LLFPKKKGGLKRLFLVCPVRHVLLALGLLSLLIFFSFRSIPAFAAAFCSHIMHPALRALGEMCDIVSFSVSEVLIFSFFGAVLGYTIYNICAIVRKNRKFAFFYKMALTYAMCLVLVYSGFCLLWGMGYYAPSFKEQSGIETRPISAEELASVTEYFAQLSVSYSTKIIRDEDGFFAEDMDRIFDLSPRLFDNVSKEYPFLDGAALRAKPLVFSKFLSYIGFTGFIFPFTGEANLNVDCPASSIPATIAHEIAHQRGVASEDEANFVAVFACLESGDAAYIYSGALMAYSYLSAELYKTDYDVWLEIYTGLSDEVRAELRLRGDYWARFESPVSTISESIYTGYLHSNGQELGMKTYGACVDLLVAHYLPQIIFGME